MSECFFGTEAIAVRTNSTAHAQSLRCAGGREERRTRPHTFTRASHIFIFTRRQTPAIRPMACSTSRSPCNAAAMVKSGLKLFCVGDGYQRRGRRIRGQASPGIRSEKLRGRTLRKGPNGNIHRCCVVISIQ